MIDTKVKEEFATSAIKKDVPIRPRNMRCRALDCRVLAVAKEGYCGDWAAYVGAVTGTNHDEDLQSVLANGSKLEQKVAEVLFPDFAEKYIWRD